MSSLKATTPIRSSSSHKFRRSSMLSKHSRSASVFFIDPLTSRITTISSANSVSMAASLAKLLILANIITNVHINRYSRYVFKYFIPTPYLSFLFFWIKSKEFCKLGIYIHKVRCTITCFLFLAVRIFFFKLHSCTHTGIKVKSLPESHKWICS